MVRFDDRISRPLGIENADVVSISRKGDLALLLKKTAVRTTLGRGTLARVPLGGGVPRPILENVNMASWDPDGQGFAVTRYDAASDTIVLEHPIGTELLRLKEELRSVAVSPDGSRIAFVSSRESNSWLSVIAQDGTVTKLVGGVRGENQKWLSNDTLIYATSPPGATFNNESTIDLVDLKGHVRPVGESRLLNFLDIAEDGTALFEREILRASIAYGRAGDAEEQERGWLDFSSMPILTAREQILFSESGEGGGTDGHIFLRGVDGSPPVMLGEGVAVDVSSDGAWALGLRRSTPERLYVVPTGAGLQREVRVGPKVLLDAKFVEHDRRILVRGLDDKGAERFVLYDLGGGETKPLTIESSRGSVGAPREVSRASMTVSPDGERVAHRRVDGRTVIQPLDGTGAKVIAGSEPGDIPIQWSGDGRTIWVMTELDVPRAVYAIDVASGRRTLWKRLAPADMAGVIAVTSASIAPDGKSWAYSYLRVTDSDLYTAKLAGMK